LVVLNPLKGTLTVLTSTLSGHSHLPSVAHGDPVISKTQTTNAQSHNFMVVDRATWNDLPATRQ